MSVVPRQERRQPVLVAGLTGGIASGKSTVCGMFRELGTPVVDADAIVHDLLAPGGLAVSAVRSHFGPQVTRWDGGIDRRKLGEIVFKNETLRLELEELIHPLVIQESEQRIAAAADIGRTEIIIYDAALLVETGRYEHFERLIVVIAKRKQQLARLIERDGLPEDHAEARLQAQMPVAKKAALADYLVDNSRHWLETRAQVLRIHELLIDDAARLRAGEPLPTRR